MKLCGLSSRWLVVVVAAVAACSSTTQQGLTGDDGGGSGTDGGIDAGIDGAVDGGGTPIDGGVMPDAPPPPPEPGELEMMCGSTPSTPDAWERCRHKRFCETHVHCSTSNLFGTAQECIDADNVKLGGADPFDAFDAAEAALSVAAGRASIDVAEFTQCLRELSAQRCTTAATAASCGLRYIGTVADGQGCSSDAECRSPGATCTSSCSESCCLGTCTARAKLGDHCTEYGECEPGLICSFVSQTCVTGDVNSACHVIDCDAGNWCDMRSKTCKPDLPEGATCLGQDEGLDQCSGETVCAGRPGKTTPRCLRATSVGDKCGFLCRGNLICGAPRDADGLGICRSLPVLNESCSVDTGCIGANVYCAHGACVPRPGLGDMCPDGTCRPGLFCTDQLGDSMPICRVPFADGESGCKQNEHCQSHFCTGNVTVTGKCLPTQSMCP